MSNLSSSRFTKGYTDFNNRLVRPSGEINSDKTISNTFNEGYVVYKETNDLSYDPNVITDLLYWNGTVTYALDHASISEIFNII